MGRRSCCTKEGVNRGAWSSSEDKILADYINAHGEGKWRELPKRAGLRRCGKSCRLRWLNYLQPNIKRGNISHDEEDLILRLHKLLGNRWSLIAGRLPGRTDNEIKNYWNTTLSKKSSGEKVRESREIGVIRTKAARLRKVFIPPPQPSSFRDLEFSPGVVDLDVEELMRAAEGLGDGFFFLEEEFVKDWGDCLLPVGAEEN